MQAIAFRLMCHGKTAVILQGAKRLIVYRHYGSVARLMANTGKHMQRAGDAVHLLAPHVADHTALLGGLAMRSRDFHSRVTRRVRWCISLNLRPRSRAATQGVD